MEKYSEAFELLEKMVAIPSTEGNEHDMGELVYNYVTTLGMKAHKQTVEGDRFNVIATAQIGNGAGKTVVLNSHMDVVPAADGWDTDPWKLTVIGDRAFGRGSTDAKGCMTGLLIGAKRVMENPDGLNGKIVFTAVVDEETYSKGARKLVEDPEVMGDYGIIGEPTRCGIGICHNGSIRPVLVIHGKTAHSSTPELGISSVRVAAYISGLVDEIQKGLHEIKHSSGGSPSISITLVKAGVKENVLPDWCELTIDRRMVPGEDEKEIIKSFEKICKDAEAAFPGAKVEIDHYLVTTGPASESKPDSEIVQKAYAACERVTGVKQTPFGLTCNTDMNHFVRKGIPCVIIGPEIIDICHKPNEYVRLDQLELDCNVVEAVIREFLK